MRRHRLVAAVAVAAAVLGTIAAATVGIPAGLGDNPQADSPENATNPCVGTIAARPDGPTLISIQGFRFEPYTKTPGIVVSVAPDGEVIGVHDNSAHGRWWTYDVDPLPDGDLLVSTTEPGITVVEVIDPATGDHVSTRRYPDVTDVHDVDVVGNGTELVMADKGEGHDRIVVYRRGSNEVVWEWRFDEHYETDAGGPYPDDWTHVNDVDALGDGRYLVSVRNFDQVVVINRSTGRVDLALGADDRWDVLFEQHNPQLLRGPNGAPTLLVADSRNDRVVEYARVDGRWERTWELTGGGLTEPRDADRLPNGNTLVVDRLGHRTLEVTPNGTVVWEFYSPWQPYDAERYLLGDEPGGPTIAQQHAEGSVRLVGGTNRSVEEIEACSDYLSGFRGTGRLVPEGEVGR